MKNITVYKNAKSNSLSIDISGLLSGRDYDSWWSEGSEESVNIEAIREICENYKGNASSYVDVQIWEHGNAKVHNIAIDKLPSLISEMEGVFGKLEVLEGY